MHKLRIYFIALTLLATAAAPVVAQSLGVKLLADGAALATALAADNNNNSNSNNSNANDNNNNSNSNNSNANENDNNSNSNNNNANENDNNENTNNNNANSNNNNGNENGDNEDNQSSDDNDNNSDVFVAPPSRAPAPAPVAACSTPGQEMTFQSGDGRVTVKVFPSLTQSVKFSIRLPIDPASVPPAPGPVVGGLLLQLLAESCDGTPIATLPAEVNLGVHYTDADAAGLNEANFTLSRLDTSANQWRQVTKQATDPTSNFTSATIVDLGYYVLHQRS